MKPIADRAEVAIDLPDKVYMGSFTQHSNYEVRADADQLTLKLKHAAGPRAVEMHLHYYLLADILTDLASALAEREPLDASHRGRLAEAAEALMKALAGDSPKAS
jgi:hypothetical protein